MLREFVNCAVVLKNASISSFFSQVKGGTKTIEHLSIAEGSSF